MVIEQSFNFAAVGIDCAAPTLFWARPLVGLGDGYHWNGAARAALNDYDLLDLSI